MIKWNGGLEAASVWCGDEKSQDKREEVISTSFLPFKINPFGQSSDFLHIVFIIKQTLPFFIFLFALCASVFYYTFSNIWLYLILKSTYAFIVVSSLILI